jgi:hypothetical protein
LIEPAKPSADETNPFLEDEGPPAPPRGDARYYSPSKKYHPASVLNRTPSRSALAPITTPSTRLGGIIQTQVASQVVKPASQSSVAAKQRIEAPRRLNVQTVEDSRLLVSDEAQPRQPTIRHTSAVTDESENQSIAVPINPLRQ